MPYCTLENIYNSPWGIVESRRSEIEKGTYGVFERILAEEIGKHFLSTDEVAQLMEVHPSTARRWLHDSDPRYILHEARTLYFRMDAMEIVDKRKRKKEEAAAKKTSAALAKVKR